MLRLSKVMAASFTLLFALVFLGNPLFAQPGLKMVKADVELIVNNGTFEFNGEGQAFSLNNSSVFDLSGDNFTIHVWVKLADLCNDQYQCRMGIVDKTVGFSEDGWGLFKWDDDDRFRFCLGGEGGSEGCLFVEGDYQTAVSSQTEPVPGVWYSVAAVKTSSRISIYVNGKLEGSNLLGLFVDTNSVPLRVGTGGLVDLWYLYGEVGEVQLFRSALSGPIIRALFEQSKIRYGY